MKIGYNFPELWNQGRELRGRVCNSSQTDQQSMVNWKNSINRMDSLDTVLVLMASLTSRMAFMESG